MKTPPAPSSPMRPTGRRRRPPHAPVEPRALAVIGAAQALSVHRNSIYRLIDAGLLRYTRLAGGEIRIPVAAIDEYLANTKTKTSG